MIPIEQLFNSSKIIRIKVKKKVLRFIKFDRENPRKLWFVKSDGRKAPTRLDDEPGMNQYVLIQE